MRIRPYARKDFPAISQWMETEEQHALWCAGMFAYPLTQPDFDRVMAQMEEKNTDAAFTATLNDGTPVGFFCYSTNLQTNEGMLRFVAVDPAARGKGIGTQMIALAARYAFTAAGADAVVLNVFLQNAPAIRCYEKAGFTVRWLEKNAITYHDQPWSRYNMVLRRGQN